MSKNQGQAPLLLRMIATLHFEIDTFAKLVCGLRLRPDPGHAVIQTIAGVGPLLRAVFVAEIGNIARFAPRSSWRRGPVDRPITSPTPPCTGPDHQAGSPVGAVDRGSAV